MGRGRPRKTDPDMVLEEAMKLFWKQGFSGTSMSDLVAATGMVKPGLYSNFGDKEALYKLALERYIRDFGAAWLEELIHSPKPVSVCFRQFLEAAASMLVDKSNPEGCFLVNCLTEGTVQPAEIVSLSQTFVAKRRTAFALRFERAEQQGDLLPGSDTEALADFFSGQILSLGVLCRAGANITVLHRVIDVAMMALPPIPTAAQG
ncbi:hypothetical protein A9Q83_09730 [Alphaproteobacteria bacterium 46_93_T64]|nr:hypothetical protein A9Q83_09730 [Alphaproteobacteria bacterium 46_93_T64]